MEMSVVANNQPVLTISTGIVEATKALKLPTMDKIIMIMTAYKVGANWNPQRIINTGVDVSTPVTSEAMTVDSGSGIIDVCHSTSPCAPLSILWNNRIGKIRKTTTPNLRETNELNAPIYKSFTNNTVAF